MNKTELVNAIAAGAGISKVDAKKALEAAVEAVTKTLKKGDKVALIGFGTLSVVKRDARTGVNPATGKKMGPMESMPATNSFPSSLSGRTIEAMHPAAAQPMMMKTTILPKTSMLLPTFQRHAKAWLPRTVPAWCVCRFSRGL